MWIIMVEAVDVYDRIEWPCSANVEGRVIP